MDLTNLGNLPSAPPPPGVIPNFVNPETRAPILKIVTSIMLPLMMVFVLLRLYSNIWISRKLEKSDCSFLKSLVKSLWLIAIRCLHSSDGMIYQAPWISKCSLLGLLQVASISYTAVIYRSMLLQIVPCVDVKFMIALSQHSLGRHIWDIPVRMNTNSSVQVNSLCGSWKAIRFADVRFLVEFYSSGDPLRPRYLSG